MKQIGKIIFLASLIVLQSCVPSGKKNTSPSSRVSQSVEDLRKSKKKGFTNSVGGKSATTNKNLSINDEDPNKVACANNGVTIQSVNQVSGMAQVRYVFHATNAAVHKWSLISNSTVAATGTVTATSSIISFDVPESVQSGNYTLEVDIQNCIAKDSQDFSYTKPGGGGISAPNISSNPSPAIEGITVSLSSSNCSYSVDWYKNGNFLSTGASYTISSAAKNDKYSARCKNGSTSSGFSNEISIVQEIVIDPNKVACAGNGISLLTANQVSGRSEGQYTFHASNASVHKWSLMLNGSAAATGTITATSSTINFSIPDSVQSGNYNLEVDIQNCIAKDSRSFSYTKLGGVIAAPTISSNPSPAIAESGVNFSAANCSNTVEWFKNGSYVNTGANYSVSSAAENDTYSAFCKNGTNSSSVSNLIVIAAAFPIDPNKVACLGTGVHIIRANQISGEAKGTYNFHAFNAAIHKWSLMSNGSAVASGVITATSSVINFDIPNTVQSGNYTLLVDIQNCKAQDSIAFNYIKPNGDLPTLGAPSISSNPNPATAGGRVDLSSSNCAYSVDWYKNGNFLSSGGTYIINTATVNDNYSAKCKNGSLVSVSSNQISIVNPRPPIEEDNGTVKITQPNRAPYYFSDNHPPSYYDDTANLPLIFKNQPHYSNDEMVYLENDKIKIGINLKRGGQIAWASLINGTENLVYNGYDGGFQITLDAYQKRDGYTQGGEVAGSGIPGSPVFSYNVTHGGDFQNNAATLIDYHPIPNGYYVKLRPIHYPLTAKMSETYIESTYVLEGRSLKITYKYTSFRTDGQYEGGGFDGGGVPACFIVNKLTHYKTYTGDAPWSREPIEGARLPITNEPYNQAVKGTNSTEHWGMVYDPARPNSGIGVFNNVDGGESTYFHFKQLEVYPGNAPGDEFTGGFTFFQANSTFGTKNPGDIFKKIQDRSNYSKQMTVYLMIGSESEIRDEAYKHAGR